MARFLVGPSAARPTCCSFSRRSSSCRRSSCSIAARRLRTARASRRAARSGSPQPLSGIVCVTSSSTPYLRLLAALVFLVAIVTQWTNFQLGLMLAAALRQERRQDRRLLRHVQFRRWAIVGVLLQLFLTGPLLRRFGVPVAVLLLPLFLASGSAWTLLLPGFWAVAFTNAADHGACGSRSTRRRTNCCICRSLPAGDRSVKNAIDIVGNRIADAVGGVHARPGDAWVPQCCPGSASVSAAPRAVTLALEHCLDVRRDAHPARLRADDRREHSPASPRQRAVHDSAHARPFRSPEAIATKLSSASADDVKYALDVLAMQPLPSAVPHVRQLLAHAEEEVRRRAMAALGGGGGPGFVCGRAGRCCRTRHRRSGPRRCSTFRAGATSILCR